MTAADLITTTLLTLRIALVAVVIDLVPGIALGYALGRGRVPLRPIVRTIVVLPIVLPPVAIGLVIVSLFARGTALGTAAQSLLGHPLLLSWEGAALASAVMAFPLLVLGAESAFAGVPRRVENAAATLGAGRWQVFREVTLPLAQRGILYGVVFAFARALGEFGATTLVAGHVPGETETLSLAIYSRIEAFDDTAAWRLAAVSLVLALLTMGAAEHFLRRRGAESSR